MTMKFAGYPFDDELEVEHLAPSAGQRSTVACGTSTDMIADLARLTHSPHITSTVMPDEAMAPTLSRGMAVFANTRLLKLRLGQVYVFAQGDWHFVRRLGWMAGDTAVWCPDNAKGGFVPVQLQASEFIVVGRVVATLFDQAGLMIDPLDRRLKSLAALQARP